MYDSKASLTWKMWQGRTWLSVNVILPTASASRVGCALLREFAGRRYTPHDLDVSDETRRFSYRSDTMVLLLRRLDK